MIALAVIVAVHQVDIQLQNHLYFTLKQTLDLDSSCHSVFVQCIDVAKDASCSYYTPVNRLQYSSEYCMMYCNQDRNSDATHALTCFNKRIMC